MRWDACGTLVRSFLQVCSRSAYDLRWGSSSIFLLYWVLVSSKQERKNTLCGSLRFCSCTYILRQLFAFALVELGPKWCNIAWGVEEDATGSLAHRLPDLFSIFSRSCDTATTSWLPGRPTSAVLDLSLAARLEGESWRALPDPPCSELGLDQALWDGAPAQGGALRIHREVRKGYAVFGEEPPTLERVAVIVLSLEQLSK